MVMNFAVTSYGDDERKKRHRNVSTRQGSAPSDDKKAKTPEELFDDCREAALRLLDAAPRSSKALEERLLSKGYGKSVVHQVIERLTEVNLLNDRAYAESMVRYGASRLLGKRGVVMEMQRKGVDRALAEEVAEEAREQGVFEDTAWELGRRVAQKTEGLSHEVRYRRFWSAGARKGHSPDTLRRVAAELLDD